MADLFSQFKEQLADVENWLSEEYKSIRAGRVTPALVDGVKVEVYSSTMSIQQLATVMLEDPRTLRITPWDLSTSQAIESAIQKTELGVSIQVDEAGLRVSCPELTSERRDQLVKVAKQKLEDARVSVRVARDEVWDSIQKQEKSGEITEDDKYRLKEQMEKLVTEANEHLEEMEKKKEKEIHE